MAKSSHSYLKQTNRLAYVVSHTIYCIYMLYTVILLLISCTFIVFSENQTWDTQRALVWEWENHSHSSSVIQRTHFYKEGAKWSRDTMHRNLHSTQCLSKHYCKKKKTCSKSCKNFCSAFVSVTATPEHQIIYRVGHLVKPQ